MITTREILFSIIIFVLMLGIGLWFHDPILFPVQQSQLETISAIQIDKDVDKFDYIGRTDVGDFLANGTLSTPDPVSIPDIPGKYMYIEKTKEKYTMHTETYTTTDDEGHTHTHTRTYWSWDVVDVNHVNCNYYTFLGKTFPVSSVHFNIHWHTTYYDTIKESSDIRYIYYIFPMTADGCMTGNVKDKTYNHLVFNHNRSAQNIIDSAETKITISKVLYWFMWLLITGGLIFGFYYLENDWLEDDN